MLLRYDPFRDVDQVTERFFGERRGRVPMDAVRRADHVELYFDLPGVSADSLDVTVEKNVLTVRAERRWAPREDDEVIASERFQGDYSRQVLLGDSLDTERVEAAYRDGVLILTVPVAEQAKARKVEIKGTPSKAIDVESS